MVFAFVRQQFKCYRRLWSNTQCCLLEFLVHWKWSTLIRRNFVSSWGNVVWLMTEVFSDGDDGTKSCADCLRKFCGLSLAASYRHHRSIQSTSYTRATSHTGLSPHHAHVHTLRNKHSTDAFPTLSYPLYHRYPGVNVRKTVFHLLAMFGLALPPDNIWKAAGTM